MSPKSLTETEKDRQRKKIIGAAQEMFGVQGTLKKLSVDDIARAAGLAKGSFYQYFPTKEVFLYECMWDYHQKFFAQAEQIVAQPEAEGLPRRLRGFIGELFSSPETIAFFRNHKELSDIIESAESPDGPYAERERAEFEKLLRLANIDTEKVRPGVVHNLIHALYLVRASDLMIKDSVQEASGVLLDAFLMYIFGGAS